VIESQEYKELIARESLHWSEVNQDAENPQIWHDPVLFEIFFGKEYRRLLDQAAAKGPRILELGCGEGGLSLELAARGMQVTGIDLSDERIQRASAKANAAHFAHPPVFVRGELNTVELPAGSYDCVVAHDSLHHILHLGRLCDEVERSLRPGGSFLVMDYVGMRRVRKLLGAVLFGILPTYQPYRKKWELRKRLGAFLATEDQKRDALECSSSSALHQDSPFEEISQGSIITEVQRKFRITELETYCPFWFYLAAKVRIPAGWKQPVARTFRALDDLIVKTRLAKGAYVWIAAQKISTTS
jgi:2-polyprenyl-3-methyl-5-hydroxy-6-metoxy-1,4-benzoquinol methylase